MHLDFLYDACLVKFSIRWLCSVAAGVAPLCCCCCCTSSHGSPAWLFQQTVLTYQCDHVRSSAPQVWLFLGGWGWRCGGATTSLTFEKPYSAIYRSWAALQASSASPQPLLPVWTTSAIIAPSAESKKKGQDEAVFSRKGLTFFFSFFSKSN